MNKTTYARTSYTYTGFKLFFSRKGQIFSRGLYFEIFPGKRVNVKYRKFQITVLNCYSAVNCPKTTPISFWHFLPKRSTTTPGVEPPSTIVNLYHLYTSERLEYMQFNNKNKDAVNRISVQILFHFRKLLIYQILRMHQPSNKNRLDP